MKRNLGVVLALVAVLALATACAVTHTTVASALAGNEGEAIELEEAQITSHISVVPRTYASDLLVFDVTDRAGDTIRVEVSSGNVEYENEMFVRVRGTLRTGGSPLIVTSSIVSRMAQEPDDWPH